MRIPNSKYLLLTLDEVPLVPFKAIFWWYTAGLLNVFRLISYALQYLEDSFSVREMLWAIVTLQSFRKDMGSSLADRITTRGLGVVFRTIWLCIALVCFAVASVFLLAVLIFWIAFPALCIFEIIVNFGILFGNQNLKTANPWLVRKVEELLSW